MKIIDKLKNSIILRKVLLLFYKIEQSLIGEKAWAKRWFRSRQGKELNLEKPKTINEKIVWLKVNYYQDNYKKACDKYYIHEYLKNKFGKDYAPRLLFYTKDVSDLRNETIPEFPCIIKVSNGSGGNMILREKYEYTDNELQNYFKLQIVKSNTHTIVTQEHQYMENRPFIVVEELLLDEHNTIPNDYKFMYFNGELQFIYCSVDRLGTNVRQVYDRNWNRLHFIWVKGADKDIYNRFESSEDVPKPKSFEKMLILSGTISKDFPLVRVDFYEIGEKIYIGEITLYHGSGADQFYPEEYDKFYGSRLRLPIANRNVR